MRIPGLPIPKIIRAGNPVEFKQVGYTDEGYPIWKETVKLVQNKSNEEFAYDLALKGNKYFIKISGTPVIIHLIVYIGNSAGSPDT